MAAGTLWALLVDPSLCQLDRVLVGLLKGRASLGAREYGLPRSARPALGDHPRPGHPAARFQRVRVGSNQIALIGKALHAVLLLPVAAATGATLPQDWLR